MGVWRNRKSERRTTKVANQMDSITTTTTRHCYGDLETKGDETKIMSKEIKEESTKLEVRSNEDVKTGVRSSMQIVSLLNSLTTALSEWTEHEKTGELSLVNNALIGDLQKLRVFLAEEVSQKTVNSQQLEDTARQDKPEVKTTDNRRRDSAIVIEERYVEELDKLSERFRQQKIELIKILQLEKSELQSQMTLERSASIDEVEKSHEKKLADERQVWQNIVKEYQKEVDVIRYELQNIQRNCNVAIDEIKSEYDQKLLELHAGQQRERKQWRQIVTDKMISRMVQTQFGTRTNTIHRSSSDAVSVTGRQDAML